MASEIEAQNFYRLVSLLVDNGTTVLRKLFMKFVLSQKTSLDHYLLHHQTTLDDLQNKKHVLSSKQMDLLFPANGSADIETFDITLLNCLLKNTCGSLPNKEKQDLEELKDLRNEVSAHANKAAVEKTDFHLLWTKISQLVKTLATYSGDRCFIQDVSDDIENLRKNPKLMPSSCSISHLLEWHNSDHEVKEVLYKQHATVMSKLERMEDQYKLNGLCETCLYLEREKSVEGENKRNLDCIHEEKLHLNRWFLIENICVVKSVDFFVKKKYFREEDKVAILQHGRRVRRAVVFFEKLVKVDKWYSRFLTCLRKTNQDFVAAELEKPVQQLRKAQETWSKSWDESAKKVVDEVKSSHPVQLRDACLRHGLSFCRCEKKSLVFVLYTDRLSVYRHFESLCKTGDVQPFLSNLLQQKHISDSLPSTNLTLAVTIRRTSKDLQVPKVSGVGQEILQKVVESNASYLINEIDPVPVTEELQEMNLFTAEDAQEVLCDTPVTRRHRVKRILAKCIARGVSFDDFVLALEKCHLEYIVEHLQSGGTDDRDADVRLLMQGNYRLVVDVCATSAEVSDRLLKHESFSLGFADLLKKIHGNDKRGQAMHLVQSLLESDTDSLHHLLHTCKDFNICLTRNLLLGTEASLPNVIEIEFDDARSSTRAKNKEKDPSLLFVGEIVWTGLEGDPVERNMWSILARNMWSTLAEGISRMPVIGSLYNFISRIYRAVQENQARRMDLMRKQAVQENQARRMDLMRKPAVQENQARLMDLMRKEGKKKRDKWRDDGFSEWNDGAHEKVLTNVKERVKDLNEEFATEWVKLLLLGPTGVGKSSLINTMNAALTGRYSVLAVAQESSHDVTKHYGEYELLIRDGKNKKPVFDVCDFREIDKEKEFQQTVLQRALLGELEHGTKVEVEKETEGHAGKREKAKIMLIVLRAASVQEDCSPTVMDIINVAVANDIPSAVFLTKCDLADGNLKGNIEDIYRSEKIEKAVMEANEETGINVNRIFPVVNFTDEIYVGSAMALQCLIPIQSLLDGVHRRLAQEARLKQKKTN